jgi:hypothetical protein
MRRGCAWKSGLDEGMRALRRAWHRRTELIPNDPNAQTNPAHARRAALFRELLILARTSPGGSGRADDTDTGRARMARVQENSEWRVPLATDRREGGA